MDAPISDDSDASGPSDALEIPSGPATTGSETGRNKTIRAPICRMSKETDQLGFVLHSVKRTNQTTLFYYRMMSRGSLGGFFSVRID